MTERTDNQPPRLGDAELEELRQLAQDNQCDQWRAEGHELPDWAERIIDGCLEVATELQQRRAQEREPAAGADLELVDVGLNYKVTPDLALALKMGQAEHERAIRAEAKVELLQRQLDAVDANLPPWESKPGEYAVGRVQTILNLVAERAEVVGARLQSQAAGGEEAWARYDHARRKFLSDVKSRTDPDILTDGGRMTYLEAYADGYAAGSSNPDAGLREAARELLSPGNRTIEQVSFLLSVIKSGEELDVTEYHAAHALIRELHSALARLAALVEADDGH